MTCENCGTPVYQSIALGGWAHEGTGLRACGIGGQVAEPVVSVETRIAWDDRLGRFVALALVVRPIA